MPLSAEIRRPAYRCAYGVLRAYWFLARPQVAGVKCVLTDAERVLLVRHTYGPSTWDVPGGSLRRHETPLDCARREMAEELGVRIDDWRPLGEVTGRMHHRRDTLHCFHAEVPDQILTLDAGEIATADWFGRDALPPDLGGYVPRILARLPSPGG